jgi:hypothetical protein
LLLAAPPFDHAPAAGQPVKLLLGWLLGIFGSRCRLGLSLLLGLGLLLIATAARIGRQANERDRRRGSNHKKLPHVVLPLSSLPTMEAKRP